MRRPWRGGVDALASVLGPLEYQIMVAVWAEGSATVAEVVARTATTDAYTTIKTVMERLTAKGLLARHREGRAYRYRAVVSREALERQVLRGALDGLLGGFGAAAVSQFVDAVKDDPAQLAELRALLASLAEE